MLDLCAAPGGKATILAATGAMTVAADLRVNRAGLVVENAERLGARRRRSSSPTARIRRSPPARSIACSSTLPAPASACSGAAPDARWRIASDDVDELAGLQQRLIDEAAALVRPGGYLVYSVCTLTAAESIDHRFPEGWTAEPAPGSPWRPYGDGARLLPQDADTDGMVVLRYRRPA